MISFVNRTIRERKHERIKSIKRSSSETHTNTPRGREPPVISTVDLCDCEAILAAIEAYERAKARGWWPHRTCAKEE
jgi:hypothetical protein